RRGRGADVLARAVDIEDQPDRCVRLLRYFCLLWIPGGLRAGLGRYSTLSQADRRPGNASPAGVGGVDRAAADRHRRQPLSGTRVADVDHSVSVRAAGAGRGLLFPLPTLALAAGTDGDRGRSARQGSVRPAGAVALPIFGAVDTAIPRSGS